jgi:hypothetical protein
MSTEAAKYIKSVNRTIYPGLIDAATEWVMEGWCCDDASPPMLATAIINQAMFDQGDSPEEAVAREQMLTVAANILNYYFRPSQWIEKPIPATAKKAKIHIVTQNDGTGDEPVLATTDEAKALAKYLEIIKDADRKSPEAWELVHLARVGEDGINRIEVDDTDYVEIDGEWYETRDQYGDGVARWFELELE